MIPLAPGEVGLNYNGPLLADTCRVYENTPRGQWTRRGADVIRCAVQDDSGGTAITATGEVTRTLSTVFLELGTEVRPGWRIELTGGRRLVVQSVDQTTGNALPVARTLEVRP